MFSARKEVEKICWLDRSLLHNPEVKEIIVAWQRHHKDSIGETIKLLQSYVENGRIELVSVNLEEIEKALKMSS